MILLIAVMWCSHYHDERHDWNQGLYRGLIAGISSYQIIGDLERHNEVDSQSDCI